MEALLVEETSTEHGRATRGQASRLPASLSEPHQWPLINPPPSVHVLVTAPRFL